MILIYVITVFVATVKLSRKTGAFSEEKLDSDQDSPFHGKTGGAENALGIEGVDRMEDKQGKAAE